MTRWQKGQVSAYNRVLKSPIIKWDYPEMYHRWVTILKALKEGSE